MLFCFNLLDKVPRFFCILLGRHHILACFGLDLAELLETEIASNGNDYGDE